MSRGVALDPRAVVLAGIGTRIQRERDPARAREPLALMIDAARRAIDDAGLQAALDRIGWIAVPKGRWRYRDPAGAIATALGIRAASTCLAQVGVLQQTLIGDACMRIGGGEIEAALIVGGDAGDRLARARRAGLALHDATQDTVPDVALQAEEPLLHPVELRAGVRMPAPLYAILESVWRHRAGETPSDHRLRIARLYAGFSAVAAANPDAWRREPVDAGELVAATPRNPWIATPYTRMHCASWNVDQAGALLLVSAALADRLGIPETRRVYAWSSTESNHMVPVSARVDPVGIDDARLAAHAALDHPGLHPDDLGPVDLYSCFPIAVQAHAAALALSDDRPLTVTGGMSFAGGPFNNAVLQSTCAVAAALRSGTDRLGVVTSVSGIPTKHAFGLWGRDAPPDGLRRVDVTPQALERSRVREVIDARDGAGRIVGATVVHEGDGPPRALALIDLDDGPRTLAWSDEAGVVSAIAEREGCGGAVRVGPGRFVPAA